MPELSISNELRGDLGEKIFEHYCIDQGFCYITLEQIYNNLTPKRKLSFCHGRDRIDITIPNELVNEIWDFSIPTNGKNNRPYFVFDYLTIPFRDNFKRIKQGIYEPIRVLPAKAFYWVEVKTGESKLTDNQKVYADKAKIKVKLFRIKLESFDKFEVQHETIGLLNYSNILREETLSYSESPNMLDSERGSIVITVNGE